MAGHNLVKTTCRSSLHCGSIVHVCVCTCVYVCVRMCVCTCVCVCVQKLILTCCQGTAWPTPTPLRERHVWVPWCERGHVYQAGLTSSRGAGPATCSRGRVALFGPQKLPHGISFGSTVERSCPHLLKTPDPLPSPHSLPFSINKNQCSEHEIHL